jgi:hypothetical protein
VLSVRLSDILHIRRSESIWHSGEPANGVSYIFRTVSGTVDYGQCKGQLSALSNEGVGINYGTLG